MHNCCIKPWSVNIDVGLYFSVYRSGGRQKKIEVGITLRVFLNIKSRLLLLFILLLLLLLLL